MKWILSLIAVVLIFSAVPNAWASRDPLGGGSWIDRDPVGERAAFNLYSYVDNDPINLIDPFGLKPGDPYKTPEQAAIQALEDINVTSDVQHVEYAGRVYRNPDGTYSYTAPTTLNQATHSNPGTCPAKTDNQGPYHTHPKVPGAPDPQDYSDTDINNANHEGKPSYLDTPNGDIKKYDPATGKTTTLVPGAPHYNPTR